VEIQKISEAQYKAVRSSGAGGQNVNKVSSKVVLTFDVQRSGGLSDEEKVLQVNLSSRLTMDFVLILNCDEDQTQFRNKIVTKRFWKSLKKEVPKIRKATKS
jgi:ribosome-associated protein